MTRFCISSIFAASLLVATSVAENEFERDVKPFLAKHCVECHGAETQEADLRLDTIESDFESRYSAEKWSEVLDRLNLGDMPPEEEPRPDVKGQQLVTDWITGELRSAIERQQRNGGHVVLRRLNRGQYNNTIRDLIGVDFQAADSFPEDPSGFGFDNVGTALNLSPLHIEKYIATAREIIHRANLGGVQPEPFKWHFEADVPARNGKENRLTKPNRRGRPLQYAVVYARDMPARGEFAVVRMKRRHDVGVRKFWVHRPGRYIVRIRAAAFVPTRSAVESSAMTLHEELHKSRLPETDQVQRKRSREYWENTRRDQLRQHFTSDSMYDYGPPRMRTTVNAIIPLPAVDVTSTIDNPTVFEFPVYLDSTKCEIKISNDYNVPETPENRKIVYEPGFSRPELLIDWFEVEGPIDEEWPPNSRQQILRSFPKNDPKRARKVLATFMKRAYRRPVLSWEVNQMVRLFRNSFRETNSFEASLEVPLVAILSSPHFLHLVEEPPAPDSDRRVGNYELANRLSFWLWNTMPDETSFHLAKEGQLHNQDVMLKQIDRMLADSKSDQFVDSFTTQWLQIRDLSSVSPDKRRYTRFDEHLLTSFTSESVSFFRELLDQDLPISNFLRSDFVMLNQRLARHYAMPKIEGDNFRRVNLSSGARRGPLLSQASIHMATSNGTRTSPVKRGTWILTNVLGTPPPSPPPNTGDIKPGVPGINKATVRDRLDAHRANTACATCHDKIDPLGFALENYNAIGRWRDREGFGINGSVLKNDPPIDSHGRLPDGRSFENVSELQQILVEKQQMFYKCLVEKMMIYALGRGLDITDRPTIESIVARLPDHGLSLRGMIKDIATSDAFLKKTIGGQP